MQENTIIITAGGIGKRMGGDIPKQFLLFGDTPILMQTISCFYTFDSHAQLLVTLPEDWKSYWRELCDKYQFMVPHTLISGGKERYHSIQLALQHATGNFVAVHDGVRPNVSQETIQRCFASARNTGSGIPVLEVKSYGALSSFINAEYSKSHVLDIAYSSLPTGSQTVQLICAKTNYVYTDNFTLKGTAITTKVGIEFVSAS